MGRRDVASTSTASLRKGPWMAEEDEVLIEHVRKYGPRDWSSIRSKGLLPRSGKSCRLRWVNKLKPNLKTGCKFSPEEERIVIELQAQFGNKWARIATYLPGRTDNDVKNFWSTRQKRLARLLKARSESCSENPLAKSPSIHHGHCMVFEENQQALIPYGEQYPPFLEYHQDQMNNLQLEPTYFGTSLSQPEPFANERKPSFQSDPSHPLSYFQLPPAFLDLPLIPETHPLAAEFEEVEFDAEALARDVAEFDLFAAGLSVDPHGNAAKELNNDTATSADGYFEEFPVEMLDGLDPPMSPSPP
ncbi:myb-like HTH transcriptional regulator family protein [Wolffia australiana]